MSSTANKRQQVRNERTLQDLIKTVPGNDRCADCAARNPGGCLFLPELHHCFANRGDRMGELERKCHSSRCALLKDLRPHTDSHPAMVALCDPVVGGFALRDGLVADSSFAVISWESSSVCDVPPCTENWAPTSPRSSR